MLRQALLIVSAAGGLSACTWGYDMPPPPPSAAPAGYASSYWGPIVLPPEAAYAYRGTQWGPWGAAPAGPTAPAPVPGPYISNGPTISTGPAMAPGAPPPPASSMPTVPTMAPPPPMLPPPSLPPAPPAARQAYTGALTGPGVPILDDWLRETREGRAIVTLGFRDAGEGVVSEDVAHRANIWFRHYADHNRDMVLTDEEIRAGLVAASVGYLGVPPPAQPG